MIYIGNVGAIFRGDQKDSFYDLAFKFAIHKINKDPRILPKSLLTYDIQYVDKDDSFFHTNKQGVLFFNSLYIVFDISQKNLLTCAEKLKSLFPV